MYVNVSVCILSLPPSCPANDYRVVLSTDHHDSDYICASIIDVSVLAVPIIASHVSNVLLHGTGLSAEECFHSDPGSLGEYHRRLLEDGLGTEECHHCDAHPVE